MPKIPDGSQDKLADLAARIDRFERATAPQEQVREIPPKPTRTPISPREKTVRRWVLAVYLGSALLVAATFVVQGWGIASPWMLIASVLMTFVAAIACYGFQLFHWALAKEGLSWLRNRSAREQ